MKKDLENLIETFLKHLRFEVNSSLHTVRNYESDLRQFKDFFSKTDPDGNKVVIPFEDIDHQCRDQREEGEEQVDAEGDRGGGL